MRRGSRSPRGGTTQAIGLVANQRQLDSIRDNGQHPMRIESLELVTAATAKKWTTVVNSKHKKKSKNTDSLSYLTANSPPNRDEESASTQVTQSSELDKTRQDKQKYKQNYRFRLYICYCSHQYFYDVYDQRFLVKKIEGSRLEIKVKDKRIASCNTNRVIKSPRSSTRSTGKRPLCPNPGGSRASSSKDGGAGREP